MNTDTSTYETVQAEFIVIGLNRNAYGRIAATAEPKNVMGTSGDTVVVTTDGWLAPRIGDTITVSWSHRV